MEGGGRLAAIFANNELFYDRDASAVTENRLTPIGLAFRVRDGIGVDLYYMLQSLETAAGWRQTHILGTHVAVGR